MKVRLSLALSVTILAFAFGLFGCSSSSEPKTSDSSGPGDVVQNGSWTLTYTTDEFGDVTDESQLYLRSEFEGTFSNTATNGSELSGVVGISWFNLDDGSGRYDDGAGVYAVYFTVSEYGTTPFTYLNDVDLANTLKTKSPNGEKNSYGVVGVPPDGALVVFDYDGTLIESLRSGGETECVMTYENTVFYFTLDGTGFSELFDQYDKGVQDAIAERLATEREAERQAQAEAEAELEAQKSHSTEEALERVVIDDGLMDDYAALYLSEHVQEYQVLGQSEVELLFPGTYVFETVWSGGTNGGAVYEFAGDGTCKQMALMPSAGEYQDTSNSKGVSLKLYAIQEGRLLMRPDYSDHWNSSYEVRKVADGFYALVDEDGNMQILMYPYTESD